ncbi:MAG: GNAT family protein [Acidimicrobiales bacterium]|jgi:ribosomal-protein-alanine N-acetyltransferase
MTELTAPGVSTELVGRRVKLRPLREEDFEAWHEVRTRCRDWLLPWEPRPASAPYPPEDRASFVARCSMRERERQLGVGFAFGIFASTGARVGAGPTGARFVGEVNLSSVQRGPFQNAYVGYWMDQLHAGRSYTPEACVLLFRFAFEDLGLHRLQISIIPRNRPSRRVAQKLWLRGEGIALRYLEIDGKWEDHVRYAITTEEWNERRDRYLRQWLSEPMTF